MNQTFDISKRVSTANYIPPDFRDWPNPPRVVYRIPNVLEATGYNSRVAAAKDEAGIPPSDFHSWITADAMPEFTARECAPFVVRVDNFHKDGEPVDWIGLDNEAREDLLMRLGVDATSRFVSLIQLAAAIFTGLDESQKKSSGLTSNFDSEKKTTVAIVENASPQPITPPESD